MLKENFRSGMSEIFELNRRSASSMRRLYGPYPVIILCPIKQASTSPEVEFFPKDLANTGNIGRGIIFKLQVSD